MKIYLLDTRKDMCKAWEHDFGKVVTVVNDTLENFLNSTNVEAIVSPGNSKGIMDGGYDKAISLYFGWGLTNHIQKYIAKECPGGLQKVATALIFDIPEKLGKKCIHVPTMVLPSPVDDPKVVYKCMKAALQCALDNKVESVVIPAFCAGTGGVDPFTVSEQMLLAYNEVMTK